MVNSFIFSYSAYGSLVPPIRGEVIRSAFDGDALQDSLSEQSSFTNISPQGTEA